MNKHVGILLRILGYYLLYITVANGVILLIILLLHLFGIKNLPEITGEFLSDIIVLPFLIIAFQLFSAENKFRLFEEKLQIKKILNLIPVSIVARLIVVLAMAMITVLIMFFLGKNIASVIDEGVAFQWSTFDNTAGWEKILGFLSFAFFGPINEELLNRVVILQYLKKHYSTIVSIIYSSVIFMFAHIHPGLYLSSFILGLVLAGIYVKYKNIWYAIILHMLINVQPFILSYFMGR